MRIFLLLIIFIPLTIRAQKEVDNPARLGEKSITLKADSMPNFMEKLPFGKIRVLDYRYDTSSIGFLYTGSFFEPKINSFKKIILKDGTAATIEKYYNTRYSNNFTLNSFELVICMKKFWVSQLDASKRNENDINQYNAINGSFFCKWEYYLCKDSQYLPLKRIDTIFSFTHNVQKQMAIRKNPDKLPDFEFFLNQLIDRIDFAKCLFAFDDQPKKSWVQINDYYTKRYNIPVLMKNNSAKGVYKSFNEFINLAPSIKEFKKVTVKESLTNNPIRSNLRANLLKDMDDNPISPVWGYSDGTHLYFGNSSIKKMYHSGNTFQFFVKYNYFYVKNMTVNDLLINGSIAEEVWIPLQLDMETGLPY